MSDPRLVIMTAEQHAEIDRCIEMLMVAGHNERAARMMILSGAYRFGKPVEQPVPDNVVELDRWSRKAPCA